MPAEYPRQWLPNGAGKIDNLHEVPWGRVNYAARTSKRLARGLFHAMARRKYVYSLGSGSFTFMTKS